jgi:hypothetical protein
VGFGLGIRFEGGFCLRGACFVCLPGVVGLALICFAAQRFLSVRLGRWPFLELLVVY